MTDIFIKLLNMSIVAGWLVIAVLLLRLALRKAPRWIFCVLWAFVALRLLIPFSVQSKTSAVPSVETVPPEIVYTEVPEIHTGWPTFNSYFNPYISEILSPKEPENDTTEEPEETPAKKLIDIGATVWLCGMAGMAVYVVISYALLKRKIREAVKQENRIFVCDNVSSPFIMGVLFPKIYLPSSITEADAEMVIAHEQAHIKRKDHLWKPFGFLLLTVYWFNPLLWVAYVMFCKDIESACDEKVIKKYGLQIKNQYSEALLNCSVSGKWVTACPVAFGETAVKSRIKGVLNYKKPAFWIIIIAVLACIATSVFFLTDPLSNETSDDMSNVSDSIVNDEDSIAARFKFKRLIYSKIELPNQMLVSDYTIFLSQLIVTTDNRLLIEQPDDSTWSEAGTPEKSKLYKNNFDDMLQDGTWEADYNAELIRTNAYEVYMCNREETGTAYLIYFTDGTIMFMFGTKENEYSETYDSVIIAEYSVDNGGAGYILPYTLYDVYTYNFGSDNAYPATEASIYLEKYGNHFTYGYRAHSAQQYCPYGTYRYDGDKLYLETADGKNTYVFERTNEGLKYMSHLSSPLPMTETNSENKIEYIPANTIFIKSEDNRAGHYAHVAEWISQSAYKDVDGDGQYELCVILPVPESNVPANVLAIYDGCDRVAEERIIFKVAQFAIGTDGSIMIKLWNEDTHYDFRITDEGIICTNTETGEEMPFSEMGRRKQ